jgi:hypothetical protein
MRQEESGKFFQDAVRGIYGADDEKEKKAEEEEKEEKKEGK